MAAVNAIEIADSQRAWRTIGQVRRAAGNLHKDADDAVRKTTPKYKVERGIVMIYRAF